MPKDPVPPGVSSASTTSGVRAQKAAATRLSMLKAARHLFVRDGYQRTTIDGIAETAGVATQTVYFTFKNKHSLLRELLDSGSGAGAVSGVASEAGGAVSGVTNGADGSAAALLVQHVASAKSMLVRNGALLTVLEQAAITDVEARALWEDNLAQRRSNAHEFVWLLKARDDVSSFVKKSASTAVDVVFATESPEQYRVLTVQCGWTEDQWESFVVAALTARFLD